MDPLDAVWSAFIAAAVAGAVSYLRERQLLDRKAEIDYRSNAKRRLYEAIGPLRLQLLFAARDLADRIPSHLSQAKPQGRGWNMDINKYYVRSFVYRILRPLAIGQLIHRQMSVADFAVDKSALELLTFEHVAGQMLSGDEIILGNAAADWSSQSDHLFRDNLRGAAAALVVSDPGSPVRVMEFAEFVEHLSDTGMQSALTDLFAIFGRCRRSLLENPIFWLRLVGYGYACNRLVSSQGPALGFHARSFDGVEMLGSVDDASIAARPSDYVAAIEGVSSKGL